MLKAPKPYRRRKHPRMSVAAAPSPPPPPPPPPVFALNLSLDPDQSSYGDFDAVTLTVSWTGGDDGQDYIVLDSDGGPIDIFQPNTGGGPNIYPTNVGSPGMGKVFVCHRQSDGANDAETHPFDVS